ncbi:hypothetical protein CY35_12G119800 [Sphagnum magellanicum]|nr:hypothetical protein CY35_12G119800 [Sphagnum magellanicum]
MDMSWAPLHSILGYHANGVMVTITALYFSGVVKVKDLWTFNLLELEHRVDMAHKILCPESHVPEMITGGHECSIDVWCVGHLIKTSKCLDSYASVLALEEGRRVHEQIIQSGCKSNVLLH